MVKFILFPIFTSVAFYLINISVNKFRKSNDYFEIEFSKNTLISLIITVILFNVYFFVLIKLNGTFIFTWNRFPINTTNIYFQLLPQLITYLGLAYFFLVEKQKMKKLI